MRVLVTGGNRFVGLQLVRGLHRHGHDVTVINSHPVPYPAGVRRVHGVRDQGQRRRWMGQAMEPRCVTTSSAGQKVVSAAPAAQAGD